MNEIKTELEAFGAVVQGWPLDDIPEALRTLNVCLAAVRRSGWALRDVPADGEIRLLSKSSFETVSYLDR